MYFSMNRSPSTRAFSTFLTKACVRASAACCCGSCWRMMATRRSRSSADPPQGLNRISAAMMFRNSSAPSAARTLTRGSFIEWRFSFRKVAVERTKLKLLGIVDVYLVTVKRLALRRGQDARHSDEPEQVRALQLDQQLQQRLSLLRADVHLQHNLVLRRHRRMNGDHPHVVWKNLFQIRENLGPTDPFAIDQGVEQKAAVEHLCVLRFAQHGVLLGLLDGDRPQLSIELVDFTASHCQPCTLGEIQ